MKYLGGGASFYRAIISRAREILNNKIRTTRPIMTQDYIRDVKAKRAVRGGGGDQLFLSPLKLSVHLDPALTRKSLTLLINEEFSN